MQKAKVSSKHSQVRSQRSNEKVDKPVEIFGVTIFGTHRQEVLKKIGLQRKDMLHVATVNPEYVMEARHSPEFREILTHCLTVADGHGVVWAYQIINHKFPALPAGRSNSQIERISGARLVEEILKRANKRGEKVFLLGAKPGIAEKAATEMARRYPGARYAWFEGARTVAVEASEEASMTIAKINGFEPDYLLVAYGSPWQDIWIEENRSYLRTRVAMGVGGVLDEWAGVVAICPKWLDRLGLKWAWRVIHEPWRLSRVLKVFQFATLVLYHKLVD
ncbi:MAG: WecB/TagA/CpsF family glycosyltransferase [bacterium]